MLMADPEVACVIDIQLSTMIIIIAISFLLIFKAGMMLASIIRW